MKTLASDESNKKDDKEIKQRVDKNLLTVKKRLRQTGLFQEEDILE